MTIRSSSALNAAGAELARVARLKQEGVKRRTLCAACGKPCASTCPVTRVEFISPTTILADVHFACGPACVAKIGGNIRFASPAGEAPHRQKPERKSPHNNRRKPIDDVELDALSTEDSEDLGIAEVEAVAGTGKTASGEGFMQRDAEHGGHEHGASLLRAKRERS